MAETKNIFTFSEPFRVFATRNIGICWNKVMILYRLFRQQRKLSEKISGLRRAASDIPFSVLC